MSDKVNLDKIIQYSDTILKDFKLKDVTNGVANVECGVDLFTKTLPDAGLTEEIVSKVRNHTSTIASAYNHAYGTFSIDQMVKDDTLKQTHFEANLGAGVTMESTFHREKTYTNSLKPGSDPIVKQGVMVTSIKSDLGRELKETRAIISANAIKAFEK